MTVDLIHFYMHINSLLALMTSLSCKKFKRIFTLKRGHKGQFICTQKNIKSHAVVMTIA